MQINKGWEYNNATPKIKLNKLPSLLTQVKVITRQSVTTSI